MFCAVHCFKSFCCRS